MMLFRQGNRKKSTHRTPLIWCLRAPDHVHWNHKCWNPISM
jgi:hypothetical protein